MKNRSRNTLAILIACAAATAQAHFPFVVPDAGDATAKVVMSETLEPDNEVKIDLLSKLDLKLRDLAGAETPLTFTKNEHTLSLALPGGGTRVIHGKLDLGVMQRGTSPAHVLVYYPKTIAGNAFDPKSSLTDKVPVELIPLKTGDEVKIKFLAAGKPVAGKEIRVILPDGMQDDYKTDDAGLTPAFKYTGRYAAWARNWIESAGERDGKKYTQLREYATLVFDAPAAQPTAVEKTPAADVRKFATLPQAVASFGAVSVDGWLYTFGGHIADRHEYSTATVTGNFARLNLQHPEKWETLPNGPASQGLNLAGYKGKVYRVGGMQPKNAPGTEADNFSLDIAERFDPATGKWESLAKLNKPRSSHDVAVVGNKLFVIGGWNMKGKDVESEWLNTMEVLDLDAPQATWKTIEQPFQRRALIVSVLDNKIYVIGGFDENDDAQLTTNVFDAEKQTWSKGPDIPGNQRNGFSPAACTLNGAVYLSVGTGDVYKLTADGAAWTPVAKNSPRIVHRLIPYGGDILVAGGAVREKMSDLIEAISINKASTDSR